MHFEEEVKPVKAKKPRTAKQVAAFEKCLAARKNAMRKSIEEEMSSKPAAQDEEVVESHQPQSPPQVQQPVKQQQDDDEYELLDFDPDSVYDKLNAYERKMVELQEKVDQLHGKHDSLDTEWRASGVKRQHDIMFV